MTKYDKKTLAIKVANREQKDKVVAWVKREFGADFYRNDYDVSRFPVITYSDEFGYFIGFIEETPLLKGKTIVSFAEWEESLKEKWGIWNRESWTSMTFGKKYFIFSEYDDDYLITNDAGYTMYYSKKYFLPLDPPTTQGEIVGYRRIKEYPGLKGLEKDCQDSTLKSKGWSFMAGSVADQELNAKNFPEFFEPIYKPAEPQFEILKIGKHTFKIQKEKIEVQRSCDNSWIDIPIKQIREMGSMWRNTETPIGRGEIILRIEGQDYTEADNNKILETYKKFNS